jgi:hypothetical protein
MFVLQSAAVQNDFIMFLLWFTNQSTDLQAGLRDFFTRWMTSVPSSLVIPFDVISMGGFTFNQLVEMLVESTVAANTTDSQQDRRQLTQYALERHRVTWDGYGGEHCQRRFLVHNGLPVGVVYIDLSPRVLHGRPPFAYNMNILAHMQRHRGAELIQALYTKLIEEFGDIDVAVRNSSPFIHTFRAMCTSLGFTFRDISQEDIDHISCLAQNSLGKYWTDGEFSIAGYRDASTQSYEFEGIDLEEVLDGLGAVVP